MPYSRVVNQVIEHKAAIAAATGGSTTLLAWMENASVYMDFMAAALAIVSTSLAIVWYIRKLRDDRK